MFMGTKEQTGLKLLLDDVSYLHKITSSQGPSQLGKAHTVSSWVSSISRSMVLGCRRKVAAGGAALEPGPAGFASMAALQTRQ